MLTVFWLSSSNLLTFILLTLNASLVIVMIDMKFLMLLKSNFLIGIVFLFFFFSRNFIS